MTFPILVAPNTFHSQGTPTYTVSPGAPPFIDASRGIVYLDNYLFFVGSLNSNGAGPYNVIYNSAYSGDPYGPWDTTSYTIDQIYSNEVLWIDKHHNYLVAFGTQSMEFYYDAGNGLGSPLARAPMYAKQIGIEVFGSITRAVAKDKDDIYFIGKNNNNYYDVYRLRSFMVQPVGSHYIREVLNYYGTGTQNTIAGIETVNIDSHTMVIITFNVSADNPNAFTLAYFPEEDVWWTMTNTDLAALGPLRSNVTLAAVAASNSQRPYVVAGSGGSSVITIGSTDLEGTVATWPTAQYYSEVVDFDTNYWKHVSKVHAIGDYGSRTLTLNYCNDPTYTSYTACTSITPSTIGYNNSIQWNNVTRFRRGSFRLDMAGTGPCHHRGIDVVYNLGSS